MLTIKMLPAAHGDALWIEYGSGSQMRRILIDGGPARSYVSGLRRSITELPQHSRNFELMVVTHIDADHIDGAIILLQEKKKIRFKTKEFWFNGWTQLPKFETATYAPIQGEFLGALIGKDNGLNGIWNKRFKKKAVMVSDQGPLAPIDLEGGAKIMLLGPTASELKRLRARWVSAIRDFMPGDVKEAERRLQGRRDYKPPTTPAVFAMRQYGADRTPANGSSISFLLEYDGVRVLLPGDAHASSLATALGRLAARERETRVRLDAVKLPHHGSMGNVSREWLQRVDCQRWLISTNGAIFGHPDIETMELISQCCGDGKRSKKPTFYCNYRSDTTLKLEDRSEWSVIFLKDGLLKLPSKSTSKSKKTRKSSSTSRTSKKRRAQKTATA